MTTFASYDRMLQDQETGDMIIANLQAILDDHGADSVADLYRTLYKYTDCGPWLSVRLHDGTWKHCQHLRGVGTGDVRVLLVGSIVEGSDAEVTGSEIDLIKYDDPAAAVAAFNHQVEQVDDEACRLWDEANVEEED